MSIPTEITSEDMNNISNALHGNVSCGEELISINNFKKVIDETIEWLDNDPLALELAEIGENL